LIDAIDTAGIEYFKNERRVTAEVSEARTAIFAKLAKLNELLEERRFVAGDKLTAVDILLASCLFQFDAAYLDAYFLRECEGYQGSILLSDAHPVLKAYLRDMYGFLKPSVRFGSYRHHFRLHKAIETTRQLYSCEILEDEIGRIPSIYDELPNLHAILESIEKHAGERPRGTSAASSSTQKNYQNRRSASPVLVPQRYVSTLSRFGSSRRRHHPLIGSQNGYHVGDQNSQFAPTRL